MNPLIRLVLCCLLLVLLSSALGCVAKTAFDDVAAERDRLQRERDGLAERVDRLTIERDSLEEQFVEAQESYEDERIVRTSLASNLERLQERADTLDRDLGAERNAHLRAATELLAREAELQAMQSTYDGLVSDLESEVSAGQIEIERLRDGLRLNVSDDVLFASGSAKLDAIGRDVLIKVAQQIKTLDDYVEVRGHTDDRRIHGTLAKRFPTNWELAAARAARVVRLLEGAGVPGDRLAAVSLGQNEPIAPNDTADNRTLNRRIEIRLLPKEGSTRGGAAAGGAPVAAGTSPPEVETALPESTPPESSMPEAASPPPEEQPAAPLQSASPG